MKVLGGAIAGGLLAFMAMIVAAGLVVVAARKMAH